MRRVLVCGGRDYSDAEYLNRILDNAHFREPFAVVIHGDARGADRLARDWAKSRDVPDLPFPADWDGLGKKAGPIRNEQMIRDGEPDIVVAFPGGNGTADMVRRARRYRIPVREINGR